jgi:hypothetical protein
VDSWTSWQPAQLRKLTWRWHQNASLLATSQFCVPVLPLLLLVTEFRDRDLAL